MFKRSCLLLGLVVATLGVAQENLPVPTPAEISQLRTRAEAGDAQAQFELGRGYEEGRGLPQNEDLAVKWYRKAAEQGHAAAQNTVGVFYRLGRGGLEKDKAEAVNWYRRAARQGHAAAMFNLGASYYNGDGVPVDTTAAYVWFALAERAGDSSGREAVARTRSELLPEALIEGDARVAFLLEAGDQVPKDMQAALAIYRQLAESNAYVALRLSAHYANGGVVSQDPVEAERLRRIALKNPPPLVMTLYADMLHRGDGVTQSLVEARNWYAKAADLGQPMAMHNLGLMLADGMGGKKDQPAAYMWLMAAASRDYPQSEAAMEALASRMSPSEIAKAKKMAVKKFGRQPQLRSRKK